MPLAYLNRDENPLRLGGRHDHLYWDRCRPNWLETRKFRFWLLGICIFALINSHVFDAIKLLLLPPFLPILLDIVRWTVRWKEGKTYRLILPFLLMPFLTFWALYIVVPVVAFRNGEATWLAALVGIVSWRMLRLAKKIREHYLDYSLEHNELTVETREKWAAFREKQKSENAPLPTPANPNLSWDKRDQYRFAATALQQAWIQVVLFIIGTAIACVWSMKSVSQSQTTLFSTPVQILGMSLGVLCSPLLAIIWQTLSRDRWRAEIAATWHAVYVWCNSPPTVSIGARAPWSARSKYGDAENRRAYFVWQLMLIEMLLISAAIAYPWSGNADVVDNLEPYPVAGSSMFVRHQAADALPNRPQWLRSLYFFGGIAVAPLFFGCCLTTLIGPTALSCQELFDNDGALEHSGSG